MLRTRHTLTALLGTFLLVATGGPAIAKPAPFDGTGPSTSGGSPSTGGSGADLWTYAGYAVAALVAAAVVALVAIALDRHSREGHAPHPA